MHRAFLTLGSLQRARVSSVTLQGSLTGWVESAAGQLGDTGVLGWYMQDTGSKAQELLGGKGLHNSICPLHCLIRKMNT